MLGAGEGRSLMSGQKPVTSFNARKGFDLFKRPSISRTRTFFGNDFKEVNMCFGGGGSPTPEPRQEVKEETNKQKKKKKK